MDRHAIFISYRRGDTPHMTDQIRKQLAARFGPEAVFQDIVSLPPGENYAAVLTRQAAACRVFLAIIGPGWIDARDEAGERRLDRADDLVRIEIETALNVRSITLIPVLVKDAETLRESDLPSGLRPLAKLQSFRLNSESWSAQFPKLIAHIEACVGHSKRPGSSTGEAQEQWDAIENSLEIEDYRCFLRHFAAEKGLAMEADNRVRRLGMWDAIDKRNIKSVEQFLVSMQNVKGFPALVQEAQRIYSRLKVEGEANGAPVNGHAGGYKHKTNGADIRARSHLHYSSKPLNVWVEEIPLGGLDEGIRMVTMPQQSFVMGELPPPGYLHRAPQPSYGQILVSIKHVFAISEHPVTFDLYQKLMVLHAQLPEDYTFGRAKRPVIGVSQREAIDFISALNDRLGLTDQPDRYRLPSEAEWEFACRAGTTSAFNTGEDIGHDVANFGNVHRDRSRPGTQLISFGRPNKWGLMNMHGNVWEWCADVWNDNLAVLPTNGEANKQGQNGFAPVRGGAWDSPMIEVRSAVRYGRPVNERRNNVGFRLARTLLVNRD